MGCTSCGTDARLIELLLNKFINDAIKDGTIQPGLRDCFNEQLEKNTNVITCHSLEDAICQLQTDGRLCFLTPVALDYNKDTGVLSIIMSDGTTLPTTLEVKTPDSYITSGQFNPDSGKIVLTYNDPTKQAIELDVSSLKNGLTVTTNNDGSLTFTKPDGTTVSTTVPVFGNSITTVNGKLEVAHDDTLVKLPDGRLSVRDKSCVEVNNLSELEGTPLGKLGMTCFYKSISTRQGSEQLVVGMPINPISEGITSPALQEASDLSDAFRAYDSARAGTADVSGWQVASPTEVSQVFIVDGHAWSRTNRGGMTESGRMGNSAAWSEWRKLDNIPTPPAPNNTRDIVFKNSTGKITLGYGYSTEQ